MTGKRPNRLSETLMQRQAENVAGVIGTESANSIIALRK